MKGALPDQNQRELFHPLLSDLTGRKHEPAALADRINWDYFEKEFSPLYSNGGQPGAPTRLMAGCLMLKQMKNIGETAGTGPEYAILLRDALF